MGNGLKPCQWHGTTPKMLSRKVKVSGGYVTAYAAVCKLCKRKPRWYFSVDQAKEYWNKHNALDRGSDNAR